MDENVKGVFRKIRLITQITSIALVVLVGLIFAVYTDVKIDNKSSWLFLIVICVFGSAGLLLFSETIKEKKGWCIALKAISIVLMVLFIVVTLLYRNDYLEMRAAEATKTDTSSLAIWKERYEANPLPSYQKKIEDLEARIAEDSAKAKESAKEVVKGIVITSIIIGSLGIACEIAHLASTIITIDDDK